MLQDKLISKIISVLPEKASVIEAVAEALNISYDAAHRRVSLKSKFSLNESVKLAMAYDLSLDALFENTEANIIAVQKTKAINSEDDLRTYFENSTESLKPLLTLKNSQLFYSAKDLPLFYTLSDDLLSRFKMFVWLKLLDTKMTNKGFEEFSVSLSTIEAAKKLGELYNNLNTTEIWDVTTINSTLKQIHFYKEAGHLSIDDAIEICRLLKKLVENISNKVNPSLNNFNFYYNELLLMNNSVLVKSKGQISLFTPFTVLSYFQTSDKITCQQAELFLNKQLQSSKLLNTAGEKEKRLFFNKLLEKIDALSTVIEANRIVGYE